MAGSLDTRLAREGGTGYIAPFLTTKLGDVFEPEVLLSTYNQVLLADYAPRFTLTEVYTMIVADTGRRSSDGIIPQQPVCYNEIGRRRTKEE